MELIRYPEQTQLKSLLERPAAEQAEIETAVADILAEVKRRGQQAVDKYTRLFDKATYDKVLVPDEELDQAEQLLSLPLKEALQTAYRNIACFHAAQREDIQRIETSPGVSCWRESVAIDTVGLYIPGGTAPLFSTVLMLGVPARLAGCRDVILCTPPSPAGDVHPAILYAARLAGISRVFKVGGAQAIAAMAYGTSDIPKVDKIFGPGNQYVTCAKQLVSKQGIAIDIPAGPSELAVLADDSCIPSFVAADLLSQAEHGPDSQVMLVSPSEALLSQIIAELDMQLASLPRKLIAAEALQNSKAFLVRSLDEGIDLLNQYAPEHLILACRNEEILAKQVRNAGSVFLGNYSCESAGDYASGTNHTLPTNGYARAYSGVSLDSFVKKITFQKITTEGILQIGPAIECMAEAEGLEAHKRAVSLRLKSLTS